MRSLIEPFFAQAGEKRKEEELLETSGEARAQRRLPHCPQRRCCCALDPVEKSRVVNARLGPLKHALGEEYSAGRLDGLGLYL